MTCSGRSGQRILNGGFGSDRLNGGPGANSLVYASPAEGGDLVVGFKDGEGDRLDFATCSRAATIRPTSIRSCASIPPATTCR